jgi:hypothetical protein
VLTGLVARRILSPGAALAAAGITAASPLLIAADGSLMAESLFTILVTGAVLAAYVVIARPRVGGWIALGALLGAAALTRTDAPVVAPILVAVVAWSWGNSRFRVIAEPALAVLAAGGVATLRYWVSVRRG